LPRTDGIRRGGPADAPDPAITPHALRTQLEVELRQLNIVPKNSRPHHPTTCGEVDRSSKPSKWLRAQPQQPRMIAQLQALPDTFTF
jgi:hypothetical protein